MTHKHSVKKFDLVLVKFATHSKGGSQTEQSYDFFCQKSNLELQVQVTLLQRILCVGNSLFVKTKNPFKNFDSRAKNLSSRFIICKVQSESVFLDKRLGTTDVVSYCNKFQNVNNQVQHHNYIRYLPSDLSPINKKI